MNNYLKEYLTEYIHNPIWRLRMRATFYPLVDNLDYCIRESISYNVAWGSQGVTGSIGSIDLLTHQLIEQHTFK
jgi:hypothetical protein